MYYLIHFLYGLILASSLLGYALFYKAKSKLPICFFPIIAISGITVFIYLFGLLGFLKLGCIFVTSVGFFCLARFFNWEKIKEIMTDWSILFGVFSVIWLFVITRHSGLAHYDDFSHWYRICKVMNYDGTYPATPDVSFYTYVPGTATWIYFVTRFIGFSVSNCFFSQGILNIACLLCFFAVFENVKCIKEKIIFVVIIGLTGILLCCINYSTYELLVDTVLALVPMAAMIILLSSYDIKETGIPICLILAFAALIKNSCLLFVIVTFIVALKKFKFTNRDKIKYVCFWLGIPFVLYRLYFIRASVYYPNSGEAAQNMSLSRFWALMNEKGLNTILDVIKNYFSRITDIGNDRGVTVCYLWIIIFIVIYAVIRTSLYLLPEKRKTVICSLATRFKKFIIGSFLILFVYNIALLCTYVFSMSTGEALTLACFFRYFGSITIYLLGVGIYCLLKEISLFTVCKYNLLAVGLIIIYTMGFYNQNYIWGYEKYQRVQGFSRVYYDAYVNNVKENTKYTDTSYIIIWNAEGNTSYYMWEVAITWLRSPNVWVITSDDIANGLDENALSRLSDYEYLVTFEDMTDSVRLLGNYLPIKEYSVGICKIGGD